MSSPDPAADRCAAALQRLVRHRAPRELEGRVVAALEAGAREDRAVRAVASLGLVAAPEVLRPLSAKAVDPLRAPRSLDERVAEIVAGGERRGALASVADPSGPRANGSGADLGKLARLGALTRKKAPDILAERLAAPGGLVPLSPAGRVVWGLRRVGPLSVAVVAACLVVFVGPRVERRSGLVEPRTSSVITRPELELSFEFIGHRSFAEVPFAGRQRALVGSLVGEPLGGGS